MTERQQAFRRLAPHLIDFSPDSDGRIDYADRRFVFFHTAMFADLFDNMQEVGGPVIDRRISSFGHSAGRQIAEKLDAEFSDSSLRDILQLLVASGFDVSGLLALSDTSEQAQMEKIFGLGSHDGWIGEIEIMEYSEGEQAIFRAENTFESSSYGETGETECRFIPGVIAGILEHFWETGTHAEETACACGDADVCRVVVRAGERPHPDRS